MFAFADISLTGQPGLCSAQIELITMEHWLTFPIWNSGAAAASQNTRFVRIGDALAV
jgi:hypothetical protein